MKARARNAGLVAILLVTAVIAALFMPGAKRGLQSLEHGFVSAPSSADAAGIGEWRQAARRVTEDRGEPMGKQAKVDIPAELRHYSDTRRFLALQEAEWREHRFETPEDFGGLAHLIRKRELVEVKAVGANYLLFGVGGSADGEPFTYYDASARKKIPLYGETELERERARLAGAAQQLEDEITAGRQELKTLAQGERTRRAAAQSLIDKNEKSLKDLSERRELIDAAYNDAERRAELFARYETLKSLAEDFNGQTYDLNEARARKALKVRLLSFLRPAALEVLEELAASYRQKFDRPLAVTSLVRPDEYQFQLSKTNPNAVRVETPPHSTGLAFDILYKYMSAEEQSFVMNDLARLEDEGRIEVLRENRDHYHVFAFIDGTRPGESFVRESMSGRAASTRAAHGKEREEPRRAEAKIKKEERRVKSSRREARTQAKARVVNRAARKRR